jgi:hypothetical protein
VDSGGGDCSRVAARNRDEQVTCVKRGGKKGRNKVNENLRVVWGRIDERVGTGI